MIKELCIPVYLNEKIVFDLLATIEDGFSKVRAISNNQSMNSSNTENLGAGFNLPSFMSSFLGISLNGSQTKIAGEHDSKNESEERIHTSGSLFAKLRNSLNEAGLLYKYSAEPDWFEKIKNGDFIEVEGKIRKSPMIETLETFVEVMDTALLFSSDGTNSKANKMKKNKSESEIVYDQMKALLRDLTKEDSLDLILESENSDIKVIMPIKSNNFESELETELIDGQFKVLGKVIKIVNEGEHVNLFRKTSFKIFQDKMIRDFTDSFNSSLESDNEDDSFVMPKVISKLEGPIFVIIPIAVYA